MRLTPVRSALNPRNVAYIKNAPYSMQVAYVVLGFAICVPLGSYLERQEHNRMSRFRDKSALFGKEKGPDDEPSWGDKEYYWRFSQWKRSWWH